MPFKIVQTREGAAGEKKLSVIPAGWEKDGKMKWPLNAKQISQIKFNTMTQDASSVPPSDWSSFKCTVKRIIETYPEAMATMKLMSGESDTQPSDNDSMRPPANTVPISVQKREASRHKKTFPVADFRNMVIFVIIL